MKKLVVLFLFFFATCISSFSQQNKPVAVPGNNGAFRPQKAGIQGDSIREGKNLMIIGKNYGDSVVLRWAPAKATLWYFANKSGYTLVRYEFANNKLQRDSKKVLSAGPIKPWTLDEWIQKARPTDSLAAVSAQLLYGKSKARNPNAPKGEGVNLEEEMNSNYELANNHSLALFIADLSPFHATGMGLRYTDKNIAKGKSYAYVVYANTDPKIVKSDTNVVFINTAEIVSIPEMPEVQIEELDHKVKFTWNRQFAGSMFTAYYYERSEDKGKTYKRINKLPYAQYSTEVKTDATSTIEINDSLPANYMLYYYRIVGITPFGDYGKPTPPMPVMGRDKTPPTPPVKVSARNIMKNTVKITWSKEIKEPDFTGYIIGKGDNVLGPFMPLALDMLPASATEFVDTSAREHGSNYYLISAIDTAGNVGRSVPAYAIMSDTTPPAKPIGLVGTIDTTGIVHVHWKFGVEEDLMGYLVYFSNDAKHVFAPVTTGFLADSNFTDSITLASLTKHVYYIVVAFDRNRNPSAFSDALELKRPDKVPPVSPVFKDFNPTDSTVVLYWNISSSEDAVSQILYRHEKGKDWVQYARLADTINSFVDANVKKRTWYEYSLEAVDDAGLHSPKSFPMSVRTFDSGKRPDISDYNVTKSPDGKSLQSSWTYREKGDYWYVIYRSVNGSEMMTYLNLKSDLQSYTDSNLKKGIYQYSIKVVYKDGGESPLIKSATFSIIPSGK